MATNISGFGTKVFLIANYTFPAGLTITQFPEDADAIDIPDIQIGNAVVGLNGDVINWQTANIIQINLNIIANSDDDKNLSILLDANRVGKGKLSIQDQIIMNITFPQGNSITYSDGVITNGKPGLDVASEGRLKTKLYTFMFGGKIGV